MISEIMDISKDTEEKIIIEIGTSVKVLIEELSAKYQLNIFIHIEDIKIKELPKEQLN